MSITNIYVDVSTYQAEGGPFSWAMCVEKDGVNIESRGVETRGSRNATEVKALTAAMAVLEPESNIRLYTDSPYLRNTAGSRVNGWKEKGWKTGKNKPVANQDEWEAYLKVAAGHFMDKASAAEVRQSTLYREVETIARLMLDEWREAQQHAA